MRAAIFTTVIMLFLRLSALAWAADEGPKKATIGEKAPDVLIKEGEKEKPESFLDKHKNKIIVLFFFRSTDSTSVEAFAKLKKLNKDYGKKGVSVIVASDEKKEKVETFLKGKEYDGNYWAQVNMEVPYNVAAVPRVYLIDANGILVNHFHPLDDMEERVAAQIKKTPPAGTDAEALKAKFSLAKAAYDGKQYGKAYTLGKEVTSLAEKESPVAETTNKLLEQIQEAAKKLLEEAKTAAGQKEYAKALPILAELSVRFQGVQVGTDADTELGRLMGERDVKAQVRKAIDNAKGQLAVDDALIQVSAQRFLEAIQALRDVVEKYPDTDAAKAAEKAIDQINNDPKTQATIKALRAEEEAERWLDLAARFAKVKMYSKAREYYTRIVDSHPNSKAASKAKDRLKDLPEDEPEDDPNAPVADEGAKKQDAGKGDSKK